jgi:hypothetical protein
VKEQCFKEFLKQIEPFRELWRSVHFVCYAGKIENTWAFFGGRIQLSSKELDSDLLKKEADFETFFAFVYEFPIDAFEQVLHDIIETENIHLKLGKDLLFRDIKLGATGTSNQNVINPINQNVLSWFTPHKFDRRGVNSLDSGPVGFWWSVRDQRQIKTIPGGSDCLEKASEKLRQETHMDGVEVFAKQFTPSLKLNYLLIPELQIVAPLPFDLADTRKGGVRVTVPVTARARVVSLRTFFYPESPKPAERLVVSSEYPDGCNSFEFEWSPEWPEAATHATVHLFWGGLSVDTLTIRRWSASASIFGMVDEYFDLEHKRLRLALEYNDKRPAEEFELGVVRLLNILGIPTTWYGKTVVDRADAVGFAQSDGSTLVLLIECTREKPSEKFSPLAQRAIHLKKSLPVETEVLPVVFTAAHVVESELTAAAEYGLGLVGADEMQRLLELIGTPNTTPETVLQYLKPRQSIADLILGTVGRLRGL